MTIDPTDSSRQAAKVAARIEAQWGHPGEKWAALQARIQDEAVRHFGAVQDEWLDLMWTLDQYRIGRVPPRDMGKQTLTPARRLEGVYRGKGNWFASLVALLIGNQTSERLAPRARVQGFSQLHQIDVAWPSPLDPRTGRANEPIEDVRICAETKVTGAPGYPGTSARGAMTDWSNRRKELKFAATDLKLFRRQNETSIRHWGVWREKQPPLTYFLWAARLSPRDNVRKMLREAQALVDTYLEGAGLFAYRPSLGGTGYEAVSLPYSSRVTHLDDVLSRIASEIRHIVDTEGARPVPQRPRVRAVQDLLALEDDERPVDY